MDPMSSTVNFLGGVFFMVQFSGAVKFSFGGDDPRGCVQHSSLLYKEGQRLEFSIGRAFGIVI